MREDVLDCCTTWVNSCANNLCPAIVPGVYCPNPNTTSLPTVYASAFTERADSAALASVCTRTLLKSCPNLGSIKPLVPASSDCPEECNTSFTIGGTVGESAAGLLVRLC